MDVQYASGARLFPLPLIVGSSPQRAFAGETGVQLIAHIRWSGVFEVSSHQICCGGQHRYRAETRVRQSDSPYVQDLQSLVIHTFSPSPLYDHAIVPFRVPSSGQVLSWRSRSQPLLPLAGIQSRAETAHNRG